MKWLENSPATLLSNRDEAVLPTRVSIDPSCPRDAIFLGNLRFDECMTEWMIHSIHTSIHPPINQSINQLINPSTYQSINQSIISSVRSVTQPIKQSVNRHIVKKQKHPAYQLNQPTKRPNNQPNDQSTDQPWVKFQLRCPHRRLETALTGTGFNTSYRRRMEGRVWNTVCWCILAFARTY